MARLESAAPSVRLATTIHSGATSPAQFARAIGPHVRLAHGPGAQGDNVLLGQRGVAKLPEGPALLVSFVYLESFLKERHRYAYRDWSMDSGAHSAWRSGTRIDLQKYIETCKELLATDPTLTEVFALDVIGDWRAGLKNVEAMWKAGVPAIPVYHYGEPEEILKQIARDFPGKIAIGGAAGVKGARKLDQAKKIFAHVWPMRVHGFAFGSEMALMSLPWHSTDATNWEVGPCKFGGWKSFGKMSVRGSNQNLRAEVEWYLALERRARSRWAKEMYLLDRECAPWPLRELK